MNNVTLVGNAATDVDLRETNSGKKVADFRIAVNKYGNSDEADFFTVKLWERQAETATQMIHKGRRVGIIGRMQTENWTAQDGTNRSRVVIVAREYQVLGPRKDQDSELPATQDHPEAELVF
jgi:single-strand DNA-binding protein